MSTLTNAEVYRALQEIGYRIERCGASVELTHAVSLVSDLRQAIGNVWNPPDKYAAERVRVVLENQVSLSELRGILK